MSDTEHDPIVAMQEQLEQMQRDMQSLLSEHEGLKQRFDKVSGLNQAQAIKIEVLNEQRQKFIDQLTSSEIARKTELRNQEILFNEQLSLKDAACNIKVATCNQNLAQVKAELQEVHHKFGVTKHQHHQTRSGRDELESLLKWFLELTSEFNGSIERELGEKLTIDSLRLAKERMPLPKGLSRKKVLALFNN